MWSKRDAEDLTHLAVEVGDISLRPGNYSHIEVGLLGQLLREHAQGDTLSGSRIPRDQGEATLAKKALVHLPEEAVHSRADRKGLGGNLWAEGVKAQTIECEKFVVHWFSSLGM